MTKRRTKLAAVGIAIGLLVCAGHYRYTGLPPRVTRIPYVGRVLHKVVGTHTMIRRDGRVVYDFVGRGLYAPPPPPGYAGFWNVLPSPRIVRGKSYDTNGVVIASVRRGRGTLAVFNRDGSVRSILRVADGLPVEEDSEEAQQQPGA